MLETQPTAHISVKKTKNSDLGNISKRESYLKNNFSICQTCFVPESCVTAEPNLSRVRTVKATHLSLIFSDCPATIRFQLVYVNIYRQNDFFYSLYAKYHAHVIIEGLKGSTKSIEFIREGLIPNDQSRKAIFSCAVTDEGLLYGEYSIDLIKGNKEALKFVRTHKGTKFFEYLYEFQNRLYV